MRQVTKGLGIGIIVHVSFQNFGLIEGGSERIRNLMAASREQSVTSDNFHSVRI
jgi:hypothetical protein